MLGGAVGTRMLAESARDGVMRQPALVDVVGLMRRPSIAPLDVFALWLVARYAAAVSPRTAGQWLAHAERSLVADASDLWPESVLRDEAMAVLRLEDLGELLEDTPPLAHDEALAAALAWLAGRDPSEEAVRVMDSSAQPDPQAIP